MPHAVNLLYNFSTFYFADFMTLEKKYHIVRDLKETHMFLYGNDYLTWKK